MSNVLITDNEIISFAKLVEVVHNYKSHKTADEDDEYYVAETDPDAISYEDEDFADVYLVNSSEFFTNLFHDFFTQIYLSLSS